MLQYGISEGNKNVMVLDLTLVDWETLKPFHLVSTSISKNFFLKYHFVYSSMKEDSGVQNSLLELLLQLLVEVLQHFHKVLLLALDKFQLELQFQDFWQVVLLLQQLQRMLLEWH